ncbi:hypothetical protein Tco_0871610 [Tanacetum coccineum]
MATFKDWFCKHEDSHELTPRILEALHSKSVKVFHHDVIHLQFQMEECHKLLTDQVDDAILRYNVSKPLPLGVGRPALSISKMKAAYYPDVGLEQLVPDQFWSAEECKYDIAAMYGISHWWVQRQRFYIDRFSSEGVRQAVRTHMRILRSFGSMIVRIEGSFQIDRYGVQMIMRFNEIHKFSDGTLQQIDEALDYRVKEFQINRSNPGMNTRFWTKKDVDRSKYSSSLSRKAKDTTYLSESGEL